MVLFFIFLLFAIGVALFASAGGKANAPVRQPVGGKENQPLLLRKSRLLLAEQSLELHDPVFMRARVDEVYRQPNGELIVVDTKTRGRKAVYRSDVIQLSQYGYILRKMGHPVAPFGYIRIPGAWGIAEYLRVPLMSEAELMKLFERAMEIDQGLMPPRHCSDIRKCVNCSEKNGCSRNHVELSPSGNGIGGFRAFSMASDRSPR